MKGAEHTGGLFASGRRTRVAGSLKALRVEKTLRCASFKMDAMCGIAGKLKKGKRGIYGLSLGSMIKFVTAAARLGANVIQST